VPADAERRLLRRRNDNEAARQLDGVSGEVSPPTALGSGRAEGRLPTLTTIRRPALNLWAPENGLPDPSRHMGPKSWA
jgi:hypothetical protein